MWTDLVTVLKQHLCGLLWVMSCDAHVCDRDNNKSYVSHSKQQLSLFAWDTRIVFTQCTWVKWHPHLATNFLWTNLLRAGRPGSDSRQGQWREFFSLRHRIQIGTLGSTQHPNQLGTGDVFPGVKLPGYEADSSPPSSAEVKNTWIYTSSLQYVYVV